MLCAVSGGADSVCMLYLMCEAAEKHRIRVCAAHYEHGIRGEESLRDANFVEELCKTLNVPLLTEHGNVPAWAAENRLGTEEAARRLRYEFLDRAAKKLDCDYIATAHNADDNAETMIFNLTRGTGAKGLQGIPERRGNIIRPMLGISRKEIESYLDKIDAAHVEDSTNASDDYSRNLIRHGVMPVLKKINPELSSAALRTSELLRQDDDYITAEARRFVDKYFNGESIAQTDLASLHPAVSSRVIRMLCPEELSRTHVAAVTSLFTGDGLAYADVPGRRIRREQGRIYFAEQEKISLPRRELICGEELDIPEAQLHIRTYFSAYNGEIYGLFKTYRLRCESIYGNIFCTGRMPGDRFSPVGRGCTKSLKSLFTERRMTQRERDTVLVFRDERGIAAVSGFGIDERFKPSIGDKTLCIEIRNMKNEEQGEIN